jgi:hypothetical protein
MLSEWHKLVNFGAKAGLHLVVDEDGNFREENFHKCLAKVETPPCTPTYHHPKGVPRS